MVGIPHHLYVPKIENYSVNFLIQMYMWETKQKVKDSAS